VVLTLGVGPRLDPAKVLKLAHAKGSRWKLSPEMRLAYAFTEAEKAERMRAARARLGDLAKLIG
jgi:hypothetical protein